MFKKKKVKCSVVCLGDNSSPSTCSAIKTTEADSKQREMGDGLERVALGYSSWKGAQGRHAKSSSPDGVHPYCDRVTHTQ